MLAALFYGVFQGFGRLEFYRLAGLDHNGLAGTGIAGFSFRALDRLKNAQARKGKTAVLLQGQGDDFQGGVHNLAGPALVRPVSWANWAINSSLVVAILLSGAYAAG
jgi:hypothetical protein